MSIVSKVPLSNVIYAKLLVKERFVEVNNVETPVAPIIRYCLLTLERNGFALWHGPTADGMDAIHLEFWSGSDREVAMEAAVDHGRRMMEPGAKAAPLTDAQVERFERILDTTS